MHLMSYLDKKLAVKGFKEVEKNHSATVIFNQPTCVN